MIFESFLDFVPYAACIEPEPSITFQFFLFRPCFSRILPPSGRAGEGRFPGPGKEDPSFSPGRCSQSRKNFVIFGQKSAISLLRFEKVSAIMCSYFKGVV